MPVLREPDDTKVSGSVLLCLLEVAFSGAVSRAALDDPRCALRGTDDDVSFDRVNPNSGWLSASALASPPFRNAHNFLSYCRLININISHYTLCTNRFVSNKIYCHKGMRPQTCTSVQH